MNKKVNNNVAANTNNDNNDINHGSIASNRLDYQVSQAIHMMLTKFKDLNYVVIMDHGEDLKFYPDMFKEENIFYYQIKTNESLVNVATVSNVDWIIKLLDHLKNGKTITELGLITAYPIKIGDVVFSKDRTPVNDNNDAAKILKKLASKTVFGNSDLF